MEALLGGSCPTTGLGSKHPFMAISGPLDSVNFIHAAKLDLSPALANQSLGYAITAIELPAGPQTGD